MQLNTRRPRQCTNKSSIFPLFSTPESLLKFKPLLWSSLTRPRWTPVGDSTVVTELQFLYLPEGVHGSRWKGTPVDLVLFRDGLSHGDPLGLPRLSVLVLSVKTFVSQTVRVHRRLSTVFETSPIAFCRWYTVSSRISTYDLWGESKERSAVSPVWTIDASPLPSLSSRPTGPHTTLGTDR